VRIVRGTNVKDLPFKVCVLSIELFGRFDIGSGQRKINIKRKKEFRGRNSDEQKAAVTDEQHKKGSAALKQIEATNLILNGQDAPSSNSCRHSNVISN